MNSSAPSSSGSSSSGSRSSRWEEHADSNPSGANGTHFSFSDHHTKEVNNRKVPEDQERQILLLMLLAQVWYVFSGWVHESLIYTSVVFTQVYACMCKFCNILVMNPHLNSIMPF
jgi:hypothetical protein